MVDIINQIVYNYNRKNKLTGRKEIDMYIGNNFMVCGTFITLLLIANTSLMSRVLGIMPIGCTVWRTPSRWNFSKDSVVDMSR